MTKLYENGYTDSMIMVPTVSTEINYSPMIKITDRAKKEIIRISSTNPRELGLKFSAWSLRSIAGYVREKKIVKEDDGISHTTIREIP